MSVLSVHATYVGSKVTSVTVFATVPCSHLLVPFNGLPLAYSLQLGPRAQAGTRMQCMYWLGDSCLMRLFCSALCLFFCVSKENELWIL